MRIQLLLMDEANAENGGFATSLERPPVPSRDMIGQDRPEVLFAADGLNDLKLQGWGLVYEKNDKGEKLRALVGELIEHRAALCGYAKAANVPVFQVAKDEDPVAWTDKEYAAFEPLAKRPRYLLILGDLDEVSLDVQKRLRAKGAFVGRLAFRKEDGTIDEDAYRAYCKKVIAAEKRPAGEDKPTQSLYYATLADKGDTFTSETKNQVVYLAHKKAEEEGVLAKRFYEKKVHLWDSHVHASADDSGNVAGPESNENVLMHAAQVTTHASVLLSVTHGTAAKGGSPNACGIQGNPVLQQSPWRRLGPGYFAQRTFLPNGFWFLHACYGVGTPDHSIYEEWLKSLPEVSDGDRESATANLAPQGKPFVARVPQVALANPNGPLAVLGHVDMTWTYGFREYAQTTTALDSLRTGYLAYYGVMRDVVEGNRFGIAERNLFQKSQEVAEEVLNLTRLKTGDATIVAELWMRYLDLSAFLLLGDPAARLPIAAARALDQQTRAVPPAPRTPPERAIAQVEAGEALDIPLLLEFVRCTDAEQKYRPAGAGKNDYLLRDPTDAGKYMQGTFEWSEALCKNLADVDDLKGLEARMTEVSASITQFIQNAGHEQRILPYFQKNKRVVVTIRSAASELFRLPWELAQFDGNTPICNTDSVVLRYEVPGAKNNGADCASESRWGHDNRVAIAWSHQGGAVSWGGLVEIVQSLVPAFDSERDVVRNASVASLKTLLQQEPRVRILHILGHGGGNAKTGYGLLLDGSDKPISSETLGQLFREHGRHLRLVILSACQSSNAGDADSSTASVAMQIHQSGVPAVIASRYPLTMRGALAISNALYKTMVQDLGSIDDAIVAARRTAREMARNDNLAYPDNPSFDWAGLQYFGYNTLGMDYRPWVISPYRGFEPYQRKDAPLFFGRDVERVLIRKRIHQMLEDDEPRMLLVAGASGVGKSSLVMAGVVVDLQHPRSAPESITKQIEDDAAAKFRWRYVYLRPEPSWIDKPVQKIVAAATQPTADDEYTVLVVDQLEELFLDIPAEDAEKRGVIIRKLWQVATSKTSRVFVLATIGIEYLSRFDDLRLPDDSLFEERVALNATHLVLLSQISGYRVIIEEPARRLGVHVEPGLWRTLLQDVRAEPGALPLLSYTLNQLWRKREFRAGLGPILTNDAYGKLGGLSGILEKNAEECFANLPSDRHRELMAWLMVQLVTPTDDLSRATRKRAMFLGVEPEDRKTFEELAAILTAANLVVQGDDDLHDAAGDHYLELAHESLIRHWSRLHAWYREAVVWISMRHELLKAANVWHEASGHTREHQLLEGARLARFQDLWTQHRTMLGVGERKTIDAFMETCILQARRKESVRLAAVSRSLGDEDWQVRLVLARRAMMIAYGTKPVERVIEPSVEDALRVAIEGIPEDAQHWHHFGTIRALVFSSDSKWIASGGDDEIVRVWEVQTGKLVMQLVDHKGPVYALAFRGDGSLLASGGDDGIIRLWNLATGKIENKCDAHAGGVHALAFHPSGERLASGGFDQHTREWSVPSLEAGLSRLDCPRGISYSRDGRFLVTCVTPMTQHISWDVAANALGPLMPAIVEIEQESKGWEEHRDIFAGFTTRFVDGMAGLNCIYAVTNDGQRLFMGLPDESDGSKVKVWRANGEFNFDFGVEDNVQALAISKDDKLIAYGGPMGRIFICQFDADSWFAVTEQSPWWDTPDTSRTSIEAPIVRIEDSPSLTNVVSPEGTIVVGSYPKKTTTVFLNMHDGKPSGTIPHMFNNGGYRHDGKFVGLGPLVKETTTFKRQIEIHDPIRKKNTLLRTIPIEMDVGLESTDSHSPDGRFVAIFDQPKKEIVVFDTHERQGPVRYRLELPNDGALDALAIVSVPIAADEQIDRRDPWRIAWVPTHENEVYLTNLLTGVTTKVREKPNLTRQELVFSPDGKYLLAVPGPDLRVWVWNAETGELHCVLSGHSGSISGVCFDRNSKILVTGGLDAKVCVWDLESGRLMRTLETPGPVDGVAIGIEGRIAANTVRSSSEGFIWIAPDKLLEMARSLIPRDPPDYLTVAEMRRFGL
ncbi:MAG TPA: CHAT domain-containing protein [Polyangium sp.]|nr:CHAT domain-containing protein [Polyangium sp.]